jgi:hypothetical protein
MKRNRKDNADGNGSAKQTGRLELQQASAEAEKRRRKELHWMHCPKCGQKLATEHYDSVEIDLGPSCRGLGLDANELETIVASESQRGLFRSCLKILRGG